MKCAVIGGSHLADDLPEAQRSAYGQLGAWMAGEGIEVLTGSCWGYPLLVAQGCMAAGGSSIGYSPAADLEEDRTVYGHPDTGSTGHVFLDAGIQSPNARLLMRSIPLIEDADAVVSIQGNWGTLMEQATAIVCDKPLVVLEPSGGASALFGQVYAALAPENRNDYGRKVAFVQDTEQLKGMLGHLRATGKLA
jgi:predicted Rossmann-fold nucleotide-binding protein